MSRLKVCVQNDAVFLDNVRVKNDAQYSGDVSRMMSSVQVTCEKLCPMFT